MNRVEIKKEAKELAFANKWYLWKPLVFFSLIIGLFSGILGGVAGAVGGNAYNVIIMISGFITGIASTIYSVGYAHYVLEFVRGNRYDWKETINFVKKHWLVSLVVSIIVAIISAVGFVLLVIPGIIVTIGLIFYQEVIVDNTELAYMDIVKKTWQMTKGHKMDLFILALSFIGWFFLVGITFGVAIIWVAPYLTITFTLVYEKLRKTA